MLLKKIFDILLSFLDSIIPDMDASPFFAALVNVFEQLVPILSNGIAILRMFLGSTALNTLSVFLGVMLLLNFFYMMYSFIMWVVSKIPFLGIK